MLNIERKYSEDIKLSTINNYAKALGKNLIIKLV